MPWPAPPGSTIDGPGVDLRHPWTSPPSGAGKEAPVAPPRASPRPDADGVLLGPTKRKAAPAWCPPISRDVHAFEPRRPPGSLRSGVGGRCEAPSVRNEGTILHADVDSFYASVEQRDDPSLRGRPVIVGAGVVLAASYEAKAYGVRTPMGGAQARRLCPQAIVVRPRMDAYSEASKAMFQVFDRTTPYVEALSIDEAFLEVGGLGRISGTPTEIAGRLRREVREQVGLPISVGVARTKFLAKVASGVSKPDGLLVVPIEGELEFLHPLEVDALWGVGPVTATKLRDHAITTVGQVA